MRGRLCVKGHRLTQLYTEANVSKLVRAQCKCGWSGIFTHRDRARQMYREHLEREKFLKELLKIRNPKFYCSDKEAGVKCYCTTQCMGCFRKASARSEAKP